MFDLDMKFAKRPAGADWIEGENGNRGTIEYRSLFKGQAQEDLKEVAPYLIDMTLPERAYEEATYVPDFHKKFFEGTWNAALRERSEGLTHLDTGIFIRTADQFDTVWRRLRKFTRLQDENGKWLLVRFWDPRVASAFVQGLSSAQCANLLDCDTWILHDLGKPPTPGLAQILHHTQPKLREGAGPPKMDARLRKQLEKMQFDKFLRRIQLALIERYPDKSINFDHLKKLLRQAQGAGYTIEFALWGIALAWTHLDFNDAVLYKRIFQANHIKSNQVIKIKKILNDLDLNPTKRSSKGIL